MSMSVQDDSPRRAQRFSKEEPAGSSLPPRPRLVHTTAVVEGTQADAREDSQPSLSLQPSVQGSSSRDTTPPRTPTASKVRSPVPPKAKSLSGSLATTYRAGDSQELPSIQLIDLEEAGEEAHPQDVLTLLHPAPRPAGEVTAKDSERAHNNGHAALRQDKANASSSTRSPSPLHHVTAGFAKLRAGTPQVVKTVSEGTQQALDNVHIEAPKAFQGLAEGAQKAFGVVETGSKGALESTQKVFADVQAGVKATMNGISTPKSFAQSGEDFSDLTNLALKRPASAVDAPSCHWMPGSCPGRRKSISPGLLRFPALICTRAGVRCAKYCYQCSVVMSMTL